MSLDYSCYSLSKKPLTPAQIASSAPGWQLVFVSADTDKPLPQSRGLPSYCLVWGCRSAAIDLNAAVRAGEDQLAELAESGKAGCCELEIDSDFEADLEFFDDISPRHKSALEAARTLYETRTSAGQNDLAWRLQQVVCRAIATAAGGLLEDPQEGTFRNIMARK